MSLSPSVKLSKHILQSFDVVVVVMSSSMMCSVLIKTSSCKRLIASCERPGGLLLGAGTNRILSASTRDILCDRLVKISGLTSDASARVFLLVGEETPLNLSKSLSLASKTDPGNLDSPLKPVLKLFCVFALILFLEPMLVTESDCAGDRSTERGLKNLGDWRRSCSDDRRKAPQEFKSRRWLPL